MQLPKVLILIPVYNRLELFNDCIQSILKSKIPHDKYDIQFFVLDDNSFQEEQIRIIVRNFSQILKDKCKVHYHRSNFNKGINAILLFGIEYCFSTFEADTIAILDSDTIVSLLCLPVLLALHKYFPDTIVSGFNTTTGGRHLVVDHCDGYVTKRTIGGINMVFNRSVYVKHVKNSFMGDKHWDWRVCHSITCDDRLFIVSKPSVIQHTGIKEGMHVGPGFQPDVAEDFQL